MPLSAYHIYELRTPTNSLLAGYRACCTGCSHNRFVLPYFGLSLIGIPNHFHNSYGLLTTSSDYRSNVAPSDSDRELTSRRDSDQQRLHAHHPNGGSGAGGGGGGQPISSVPKLGLMAPSADSESGGSHSPSPRASRKRTKLRNQSLTSLCIISHHPFFTTFRECLFILKKLIDACNESSSPKRVGASQKINRDNVWTVLTGHASEATPSIVLHDVREIETWILRLLSTPVPVPGSTRVEVSEKKQR